MRADAGHVVEADAYEAPSMRRVDAYGKTSRAERASVTTRAAVESLNANDVLAAMPFIHEHVAIFYSGSHALGWNHARSDLDLYVVTKAPVAIDRTLGDVWTLNEDVEPPSLELLIGSIGDIRTDVEFWLETQMDQLLERVPHPDRPDEYMSFPDSRRDFLHKFQYARPLSGDGWLLERQEKLRTSLLREAIPMRHLISAQGALEDIDGCLLSGDLETALVQAKRTFEITTDALLTSHGDFTPHAKWRVRRFGVVSQELLPFARYWEIETMATYSAANPRAWIEETAALCQELIIALSLEVSHYSLPQSTTTLPN